MNGFFDMPAGYSDADLEMGALEDLGRRAARRYKGFGNADREALAAGATVAAERFYGPAEDRRCYVVLARSRDADEVGPILEWSLDGHAWLDSARAARLEHERRTGAPAGEVVTIG